MKRNPDLIREILLKIEMVPYPNQHVTFKIADYSDDDISYHIQLLCEAGFIEAYDNPYVCFFEWEQVRLKWAGHEFLDLAKNQSRWEEAKRIILETAEGINFDILKQVLLQLNQPQPLQEHIIKLRLNQTGANG
jgi:hypothetical protein